VEDSKAVWLDCCNAYTWNDPAEHVCNVFDGAPCGACGEPTAFYTVGAPGVGKGFFCRNNHYEEVVATRILTLEETR